MKQWHNNHVVAHMVVVLYQGWRGDAGGELPLFDRGS